MPDVKNKAVPMEQWKHYQKLKSPRFPELHCEKHSIAEHKANDSDQLVKKPAGNVRQKRWWKHM